MLHSNVTGKAGSNQKHTRARLKNKTAILVGIVPGIPFEHYYPNKPWVYACLLRGKTY